MKATRQLPKPTKSSLRVPDFDSGFISEPILAFGGGHKHVDPKTGLALYGPYSLMGQTRAPLRSITVGVVGPSSMIADAEAWLTACQGLLTNDGSQPFLYPHFPGFSPNSPFECELVYGDAWRESIKESAIRSAIVVPDFTDRLRRVIELYKEALEVLYTRDPRPNVVLCCIPQEIIETCTAQRRIRRSARVRFRKSSRRLNQLDLFASLDIEDDDTVHENLRRGLKAEAMQFGLPTQLVWPRTLRIATSSDSGGRRTQDIATRAWNFTTALYHKAGGSPWRLSEVEPGVCFVGLSFYREVAQNNLESDRAWRRRLRLQEMAMCCVGELLSGMKLNRGAHRI